jgi:hypothetical protein
MHVHSSGLYRDLGICDPLQCTPTLRTKIGEKAKARPKSTSCDGLHLTILATNHRLNMLQCILIFRSHELGNKPDRHCQRQQSQKHAK